MITVKRINKRIARKLFEQGKEFYMQSCNMHFNSMWQSAYCVTADNINEYKWDVRFSNYLNTRIDYNQPYPPEGNYTQDESNKAFKSLLNNWNYYQSNYAMGYYPHFYIEVK